MGILGTGISEGLLLKPVRYQWAMDLYDQAVAIVTEIQQASISMIQRRLRVGYNRAARMIEQMEREGVVGPADGAKPREVYARKIQA